MIIFIILLIPISLILMMLGIKYWRETVIVVLVWAVFEGAVRKWVFPGFQAPILQIKDIALVAAYIGYAVSPKTEIADADKVKVITTLLLIEAVYCFLEVLNPRLPSPLLGFYGLKTYIIYTPLVIVMPEIIRTREDLLKFIRWACIVAIPICMLGIYQFSQPPSAWINRYVSHEEGSIAVSAVFGQQGTGEFVYGRARTASTFSYVGGFITFVLAMVPLAASVFLRVRPSRNETIIAGITLIAAIGASLTTGARTPVVVFAVAGPLMLLVSGAKGLLPLAATFRLTAMAAILSVVSLSLFSGAASALMFRAQTSTDTTSDRVVSPLTEVIGSFQATPLFGLGIGSNSNAASSIVDSSYYWLNNFVEGEPARVMQDLGLAGFGIVYFFKLLIAYLVLKWIAWSRSKLYIATYLALATFLVPHVILITINNPTAGLFFWALAGVALSMYRMERAERRIKTARLKEALEAEGRRVRQQKRGAAPA